MKPKRRLSDHDDHLAPTKRSRTADVAVISSLSDEVIVRVLSYLDEQTLLDVSLVSKRLHAITSDSQLWRPLYYRRFILPRAHRIPGFRLGASKNTSKLYYSAQKSIWTDAAARRRSGVNPDKTLPNDTTAIDTVDWKQQYKLRYNWARGRCAVQEVQVYDLEREPAPDGQTLVKVVEGLAVTVDPQCGLRAWDLRTRKSIIQTALIPDEIQQIQPTCLAIDDKLLGNGSLDVAIGFYDGTFGLWRLDIKKRKVKLLHRQQKSSFGKLEAIAYVYPYLLTATKLGFISLYTLDHQSPSHPDAAGENPNPKEAANKISPDSFPAIKLLTSLKSHSTRPPLALSIRYMANSVVASIAYTFDSLGGWSIGIQDLDINPSGAVTSRVASTLPMQTRQSASSSSSSPTSSPRPVWGAGARYEPADDGPTRLCYSHPYLLATLPDNTLVLHLCTSSETKLSISPGMRLWGHTSGISDAEITPRGKAVSVSTRGNEIRLWELEGRVGGTSVEVRPRQPDSDDGGSDDNSGGSEAAPAAGDLGEKRNWVGFDDEMVIVLKEARNGRDSLMVYDFT